MLIIGVDYPPSFQEIAFLDQDTGECGERRLNHGDGEAEKFYRDLQQKGVRVRVGMEATGYSRWFERLLSELSVEVWIGDAAKIKTKRVRLALIRHVAGEAVVYGTVVLTVSVWEGCSWQTSRYTKRATDTPP